METNNISTIATKYGTATLSNRGYYRITSRKEGNKNKSLHRLVFEDYHNCTLDKNDIIHHIDGNPLNNHPTNLICMSKTAHNILHNSSLQRYRIVKDGKAPNGKQLYSLVSNGKRLKTSIHQDKLNTYLTELKQKEAQQCLN